MAPHASAEPLTSDGATRPSLTGVISPLHGAPPAPGPLTDQALWARVARSARCADGVLDPDEWFPVSTHARAARQEAAAAIAVCTACLVRVECLVLSLQHWDIGRHGVWGGLVAADRAQLRDRLRVGRTGGRWITVVRDAGAADMSGRGNEAADRHNPTGQARPRMRGGPGRIGVTDAGRLAGRPARG
jgi:hypothetical protein